jgi:cytochrome c553
MARGVTTGAMFLAAAAGAFAAGGLAFAQGAGPSIAPPGATSCSGCHAGAASGLPSLKGQSAQMIEEAMAGFRSGAREATLMNRIAKGFTEDETRAIARWIAAQDAAGQGSAK